MAALATAGRGMSRSRRRVKALLARADVRIDGDRPWDIRVHDERLFRRVFAEGSIGAGESYMDGWWDCERLDELFHRVLRADLENELKRWSDLWTWLRARFFNLQRPSRAFEVGRRHYDVGNELYTRMLGRHMVYSTGYWREAHTLDEAEAAKLDLVFRKLRLEPGMRVLDVGCGWGGAARYAAEHYRASVVGITVSERQAELARELCAGLPVEIRLQDYRQLEGSFDRAYSLGMFEHVGYKNYETYFRVVRERLPVDGIFLLETIGRSTPSTTTDPWIGKYIFPNSMLPSPGQVGGSIEGLFVLEDWHNFPADYDRSLLCWAENFTSTWEALREATGGRYDERFRRMWRYYLLASAGAFRARKNLSWQLVLSPRGIEGDYVAPR